MLRYLLWEENKSSQNLTTPWWGPRGMIVG